MKKLKVFILTSITILILWFLFINFKLVFVYNTWNIIFLSIYFFLIISSLILLKKIFDNRIYYNWIFLSIILFIAYFLITWNPKFSESNFNIWNYKKPNIDVKVMYQPELYFSKISNDSLSYSQDLFLFNLEDNTKYMSIPFVINFNIWIEYEKSLHYNELYLLKKEQKIIHPRINRYFFNKYIINSIEYWKRDFIKNTKNDIKAQKEK